MARHFCCMIACMLTLSVHSQPVGGLGKITDSGFTPIVFPGFMGGPNIKGMVSFDIDGDGKKDAAVLNGIGVDVVTVLRNESTPAVPFFNDAHGTSMATGNGAEYIAYGDLDGDGRQDIVVVNTTENDISVFRNTSTPGAISFDTAVKFGTVMYGAELVIEDFDHDGRPDIAIGDADTTRGGNGIGLFLNTSSSGHISFSPKIDLKIDLASTSTAIGVAARDLDGDSLPELVYCSYPGDRLYIMINKSAPGAPSFDSIPSVILTPYPIGTAIGDLDRDGKPDIAVGSLEDSSLYLLRNTSAGGAFSYQRIVLSSAANGIRPSPGRITIADLNLDGKPDLIVRFSNSTSGGVLQNTGTSPGSFSFAPLEFLTVIPDRSGGADPNQEFEADGLAVDDYDGDGKPDLLLTNFRGIYTVFYNTLNLRHNRINEPKVVPSGASPVSDTIAFYTTIDTAVQTYNGHPYLQRHYDVEPAENPGSSTATVTLYYTQQDFDNYNTLAAHGDDLPKGPADTVDKAHIRLLQYHGASVTHTPGSYPGATQIIDPDESKMAWNDVYARWEISFDVAGFSGFFLASSGTVLPLTLLSFTGERQGDHILLDWTASHAVDVSRFELERGTAGGSFATIAALPSLNDMKEHHYTYTDTAVQDVPYRYRLRMVDMDGDVSYSRIIGIQGAAGFLGLNVFPNPATASVTVKHPPAGASSRIRLSDPTGRILRVMIPASGDTRTTISLNGLAAGIYQVQWLDSGVAVTAPLLVK